VNLETLREELEFQNHKIKEYEGMLQVENQRLKDMGEELQVLNDTSSFWRINKNSTLVPLHFKMTPSIYLLLFFFCL